VTPKPDSFTTVEPDLDRSLDDRNPSISAALRSSRAMLEWSRAMVESCARARQVDAERVAAARRMLDASRRLLQRY
jgi:hypothetical protein